MWWIVGFLVGIVVGSAVATQFYPVLGHVEHAICEVARESTPWG